MTFVYKLFDVEKSKLWERKEKREKQILIIFAVLTYENFQHVTLLRSDLLLLHKQVGV